ncbi:MAG TPA: DegT/DnrJ/EryC1/StrS aminotransferase family protein, partial [Casimicrobium sp.]|nr:DegT/DnrJ/EryC1/StrS aminotransferase family protein [Casimicrobium sp.]
MTASSTPPKMIAFAAPLLGEEEFAAVDTVLRSGWIASGPNVVALEHELSTYFGGRPTRVLTSETAALEVALQLLGIAAGDEVLIGAQTFFSSGNMVEKVGAKSVFVDVDLKSRNIDLVDAERRVTPRTKAIIPTHYAGLACDMDALYAFAKKHNLRVIEDAALAVGSRWKGTPIGAFGDIALFSFHPNKNITTIEGGAL